jgi:hypothetical protein
VARRLRDDDPAEWERSGFSYPAALSLTLHLEQWRGLDGLVRVLRRMGEGDDLDLALREVYGSEYADLCRDWGRAVLEEDSR